MTESATTSGALGHDHGYGPDIDHILLTEEQLQQKIVELAGQIGRDYAGKEVLLIGVLKGAVLFMSDLARALQLPTQMEFMAVSSYGSATSSSGVVRILKDLDRDITDKHVLVLEDIIDSGLTLSWLLKNLGGRSPASLEVCALLRKPDAVKVEVPHEVGQEEDGALEDADQEQVTTLVVARDLRRHLLDAVLELVGLNEDLPDVLVLEQGRAV